MTKFFATLFSYSFRPFFLLGAVFAIIIVALWVLALHAPMGLPPEMLYWHGHEMLVGFAMSAVAGFLLTAISRWTGRPPLQGVELQLLLALWLAGRLAMGFAFAISPWLAAGVDMLFPVALVVFVAREIAAAGNARNYPIIVIVTLLACLNGLYHAGRIEDAAEQKYLAVYLLIHLVLLLIAIIAGRIIPNFTAGWLKSMRPDVSRQPQSRAFLEIAALLSTLVTGIAAAAVPLSALTAESLPWLAGFAAIAHLLRLSLWRGLATVSNPLLFVLHVAYSWLPLGYGLMALAALGLLPPTLALHALTMGAIGVMILAVTTRVALGHTGRPLQAARATVAAYWVLMLAVIARLSGAFVSSYMATVDLSALLWITAFGIFLWVYWPVLIGPAKS